MRKYRILTKEEKAEFSRLYPCTSNDELSQRFGLTLKQLALVAWRMRIRKNPDSVLRRTDTKPANTLRVGAIQLRKNGYLWVKHGEPRKWMQLHIRNWEEANGPVPPGMALKFKDGDRTNCAINNLDLIHRSELLTQNSIHNLPKEIKELIHLRIRIVKHINRREKNSGT